MPTLVQDAAQIQELEDGETLLDSTTPAPLAADQQEGGYYPPPGQTVSAYRALLDAAPLAAEPLTEKQIEDIYTDLLKQGLRPRDRSIVVDFARAIERAHGIGAAQQEKPHD